jgi:hypothetical protein
MIVFVKNCLKKYISPPRLLSAYLRLFSRGKRNLSPKTVSNTDLSSLIPPIKKASIRQHRMLAFFYALIPKKKKPATAGFSKEY